MNDSSLALSSSHVLTFWLLDKNSFEEQAWALPAEPPWDHIEEQSEQTSPLRILERVEGVDDAHDNMPIRALEGVLLGISDNSTESSPRQFVLVYQYIAVSPYISAGSKRVHWTEQLLDIKEGIVSLQKDPAQTMKCSCLDASISNEINPQWSLPLEVNPNIVGVE